MLLQDPVPHVIAKPDPGNITEWHFVIEGAEGTPYCGGIYHGKLLFPAEYPFKPPGILFITPSGRFKPYTKICFSFSDFHPECWNPTWHVGTILVATQSFMNEESSTTGAAAIKLPLHANIIFASALLGRCQIFLSAIPTTYGKAQGLCECHSLQQYMASFVSPYTLFA